MMLELFPPAVLHHGDCLDVMRGMADSSVDAIVTDPPYGLGFMGKAWDDLPPGLPWAVECLRVLKPGGYMLAFGGTRTWHRLACAVEDAGFEIRDSIAWLYGSGFPKSLDVGKAIDRAAGATRQLTRPGVVQRGGLGEDWDTGDSSNRPRYDLPATDVARQWDGWGTALKPAFEPIVVARKPLTGTVAANITAWGTGGLNIDACRVAHVSPADLAESQSKNPGRDDVVTSEVYGAGRPQQSVNTAGRWPANVALDGTQAAALDQQTGQLTSGSRLPHHADGGKTAGTLGAFPGAPGRESHGDTGGASRFFPIFRYEGKAPTSERPRAGDVAHPTVKPLELMRWLVRLVTPPGGTVLDPFAGSGTTLEAAALEGFTAVGIEREADYVQLVRHRLEAAGVPLNVVTT